jgi:acyl-coenzyme A thioesterase PaaI-like protein
MTDHDGTASAHMLLELGLETWDAGEEQHATGPVLDGMLVPGTENLRTSVLAVWADTIAGHQAIRELSPRVPVTLELGLDLYREPAGLHGVRAVGRVAKAGRAVVVVTVEFADVDGAPVGIAHVSFMAAPDSNLVFPGERLEVRTDRRLSVPFAERAGCVRVAPGTVRLPRSPDGGNASDTLNGGLLALAGEEAALSATGATGVSHLALRYLRPVRVGPAIARADVVGEVANIEIRDEGGDDRLAVLATAHVWR